MHTVAQVGAWSALLLLLSLLLWMVRASCCLLLRALPDKHFCAVICAQQYVCMPCLLLELQQKNIPEAHVS